jgi:NADH:ubiquinone oxidoreductase subunit 4 (subunit M)
VPLVAVILAFAVYPQQALDSSERTVSRVVAAAAPDREATASQGVTP